jgi:hypothetical protein
MTKRVPWYGIQFKLLIKYKKKGSRLLNEE